MAAVVSLGSVNVDHVRYCDADWLRDQRAAYDWFPAAGETVAVESVPDEYRAAFDEVFVGGKGANKAVAAAAAGAETSFLGAVGRADEVPVRERLADRGVDVGAVASVPGRTGAAFVAVDEDGENYIAITAGSNATVGAQYVRGNAGRIESATVLLLQNEIPAAGTRAALDLVADLPREERPLVVFDPAPADADAAELAGHAAVDVLTPNETEYDRLQGTVDTDQVVLVRTLGAEGVAVDGPADHRLSPDSFQVEPPAVEPVDTTGAGDVFSGYLAAELAAGASLRAAVETAVVAAALSTTSDGVQRAVPTRQAVDAGAE